MVGQFALLAPGAGAGGEGVRRLLAWPVCFLFGKQWPYWGNWRRCPMLGKLLCWLGVHQPMESGRNVEAWRI